MFEGTKGGFEVDVNKNGIGSSDRGYADLPDEIKDAVPGVFSNTLAEFVRERFENARTFRDEQGITRALDQDYRAFHSVYDPDFLQHIDPGTDVYMPLTNTKCRAAESWIKDILANAEERPWTLRPTPVPELSQDTEDMVVDIIEEQIREFGLPEDLQQYAAKAKKAAKTLQDRIAMESAERMTDVIHDQLMEGGWSDAFAGFVRNLVIFKTAFLRGPMVHNVTRLRWDGDTPKQGVVDVASLSVVDPRNMYPSPDMINPQTGEYIIEVERLSRTQLLSMIGEYGIDELAVRAAVAHADENSSFELKSDSGVVEAEKDSIHGMRPADFVEVIHFHGSVPGYILKDFVGDDIDIQDAYEAMIMVSGDFVLKAVLNPYPLGRRPYYATSYIKSPNSIWGISLPGVLRDIQRMVNGQARAIVKNTAFSAGPMVEVDGTRLRNQDDVTDISPWRVFQTKATVSTAPAVRVHPIPNISGELANLMQYYLKLADDISGIPAYVLGNANVLGAGRTLGGLSLLMNNAAKGIKSVIGNVDKDITEPIVEVMYFLNMLHNPDPTIKADLYPVARGSSGLLKKELSQAKLMEVMQGVAPFVGSIVPTDGFATLLREFIGQAGIDPDKVIPDSNQASELQAELQGLPTDPSIQPGTPGVALDGRSIAAINAMQNQQIPSG